MKLLITLALIAYSFCASAQVEYTDTVIQYFDNEWKKVGENENFQHFRIARKLPDSTWHVKDYFAYEPKLQMEGIYLDDSLTIQDGKFYYYHFNGKLERECTYNKGKPVGLYREYNCKGMLLDSTRYKSTGIPFHKAFHWDGDGNLKAYADFDMEGKGTGYSTAYWNDSLISAFGKYSEGYLQDSVWTFYHRNGKISLQEMYSAGKLLEYTCYDYNGNVMNDCDTATHLPKPPYDVNRYLAEKIKMPREALDRNLSSSYTILVGFVVDTDGRLVEVHAENKTFDFFVDEAIRVVKALPPWAPGRSRNRDIKVYYSLPVTFRFE